MEEKFETFTVLIAKIGRSIRRIKAEEMSEFQLKGPHVTCLYYLMTFGAQTASELCDRCDEDKAAISRSIDYLEKNGYIVRDGDSARRYRSLIRLTDKGLEVGRAIARKIDRIVDCAGAGLTEADRLAMYRCLSAISRSLEALSARPRTEQTENGREVMEDHLI